jgi:hypothetical protein
MEIIGLKLVVCTVHRRLVSTVVTIVVSVQNKPRALVGRGDRIEKES